LLLTNPPTAATVALVAAILLVDKVVCEEAVVVAWLVDGPVEARCVCQLLLFAEWKRQNKKDFLLQICTLK
jgi:hypothetical protein